MAWMRDQDLGTREMMSWLRCLILIRTLRKLVSIRRYSIENVIFLVLCVWYSTYLKWYRSIIIYESIVGSTISYEELMWNKLYSRYLDLEILRQQNLSQASRYLLDLPCKMPLRLICPLGMKSNSPMTSLLRLLKRLGAWVDYLLNWQ